MAAQSLLALRVEYLVEPRFPGGHWAVLLNPAEQKVPNKIREYDDSIVLDHDLWLPLHPLLRQVKAGKPTERVWHFNYSQYYHRFRAVCQREGLNLVQRTERGLRFEKAFLARHKASFWRMEVGQVRRRRQPLNRAAPSQRTKATTKNLPP